MGRHTELFKIKAVDKRELERIVRRGKHKSREILRANILLRLTEGKTVGEIVEFYGVTSVTVYKIKTKYNQGGIKEALFEKERSGRPPGLSGEQRAKITALACSNPPEGRGQWSLRLLADKAVELEYVEDISYEEVRRILKKK